jgi:hypothetical protein
MDLLCLLQIVCMQEGISHKQAEQAVQAVQAVRAVRADRQAGRLKGSRQQRPNCVRNAMACYDDDDCRKEMHFRIEPRRRRRRAAAITTTHCFTAAAAVQTEVRQNRACAALQEYTL